MRSLPDPDLSLRDASDFIFDSALSERMHLPGMVLPSVVLIAVIAVSRFSSSSHELVEEKQADSPASPVLAGR